MLYLINSEIINKNIIYTIFETHTESEIRGDIEFIKGLVNAYKLKPKNMVIENEVIILNNWPHRIRQGSRGDSQDRKSMYILLAKINEDWFKIVRYDGIVIYRDGKDLRRSIALGEIANCSFDSVTTEYKSVDTYTIKSCSIFEQNIRLKYEQFIAKAALVELDIKFNYNIEGREVKLTYYTGRSKKVIIPNFVTTICSQAFSLVGVEELALNEGLKYIGKHAFEGNDIATVEIPKSVVFVGSGVFSGNTKIVGTDGLYMNTLTRLNNNTILM